MSKGDQPWCHNWSGGPSALDINGPGRPILVGPVVA